MQKLTKDYMIEQMLIKYGYTVSEYDSFYNRYRKLKVESIRAIYDLMILEKIQDRYELENRLSMKMAYEKRRLHANHKESSKWL